MSKIKYNKEYFLLYKQKERSKTMKNNFRVILAKKRKTVADLSKDTGISKTTLTNLYYERTKNPDSQTLLKLSKALGVTIDEILTVEN
jgi:HTH DNA binding protein, phage associated